MLNPSISDTDPFDVVILCALIDEYREVLKVSDGIIAPGWIEKTARGGWQIAEARFIADNGYQIRIVTSYCPFMGREHALAMVNSLWSEFPASCLAMTGICAGRRGKVSLGDVIFADRLYSYDVGKIVVEDGKENFQGDSLQYHPPSVWLHRIQGTAASRPEKWIDSRPALTLEQQEDWVLLKHLDGANPRADPNFETACPEWQAVLSRLWQRNWITKQGKLTDAGRTRAEEIRLLHGASIPSSMPFSVHVAPLATGASVVEDAGIFARLASSMRKVLGVDMEASAIAVAGEFINVPVIVAKGVSDFGDTYKDDRYRHFAARAAAEYMVLLMRRSGDLLRKASVSSVAGGDQTSISVSSSRLIPRDLIDLLADRYPDPANARALWVRAGGKGGQVEYASRPFDMWQRLWTLCLQGAEVKPIFLLQEVLIDIPGNLIVKHHLSTFTR